MLFTRRRKSNAGHVPSRFRLDPIESRLLLSGAPGIDGAIETAAATSLTIRFDYSLDAQDFFDAPERRAALESAAAKILSRLTDTLDAIPLPQVGENWTAIFPDPSNENIQQEIDNLVIAENEIVIYAGGQDLLGPTLGKGGPGGLSYLGSEAWNTLVNTRGEAGASGQNPTDIGLWGGAITFDNQTNWHFGETTEGLDDDESDFMSVALHELAHTLGFGTAASWRTWVDDDLFFTGPASVAEYDLGGTVVPLNDEGHWLDGTTDEHHEAAMDPTIGPGERKNLTLLDFAGLDDLGWEVIPPILQAEAFFTDASGFDIEMTAGFQESIPLNLYDGLGGGFGPVDVTVVGDTVGNVKGTLVMDGIGGLLRFHKTGGPFQPDTYTVTLRSAADGFKDRNGALLDGDSDGVAGGDFVTTFVAGPIPAQLFSIADVARGPGQPVVVPATSTSTNLPIRLSEGAGATKVEVTFRYDPALFEVTNIGFPPGLPGGTQLGTQITADTIRFTLTFPAPLGAGPINLIDIIGSIPTDATYGETSTLYLEDPEINDVSVGEADSAVLVIAYFGDATGNRGYSAQDATRILRVGVGLDTGFSAYRFTDPVLVGDITGNGSISATDATQILREVVAIDSPQIPPLPPDPGSALVNTFAPTSLSSDQRPQRRLWDWIIE